MNTANNAANFNGQKPVIDPDEAALLLIDHQSGLFQTVKDMEMTVLRANATTLSTGPKISRRCPARSRLPDELLPHRLSPAAQSRAYKHATP